MSETKIQKDIIKKDNAKEKFIKCKECEYETKKEATLKKHMVTNHAGDECK